MELENILTADEIADLLKRRKQRPASARDRENGRAKANRHVNPFDPRKPNRLSRNQINHLTVLFENFTEHFSQSLETEFRMEAASRIIGVTQERGAAFTEGLSNPSCIYQIDFTPMKHHALMVLQPSLVFALLDRVLGGDGQVEMEPRELTEVEQDIAMQLVEVVIKDIAKGWKPVAALEPKVTGYWSEPERLQAMGSRDILLVIVIEVSGHEQYGAFTVCFPFNALEEYLPVIEGMEGAMGVTDEEQKKVCHHRLANSISQVEVGLPVVLGESEIAFGDVLNLKPQDVIVLDKKITEPVAMRIGTEAVIEGNIGIYNNRLALRVLGIHESETESKEMETAHG